MTHLIVGTPSPVFEAESPVNPTFAFSSLGGRYVLLAFARGPAAGREAMHTAIQANRSLFDDDRIAAFTVLEDRADYAARRDERGLHWFFDGDGAIARLFGAEEPLWVLIDPSLRILAFGGLDWTPRLFSILPTLPAPDAHAGVEMIAPVLIVPRLLEPDLCQRLIAYYEADGGKPSGTMRQVEGKTVGVLSDFKRRRDAQIEDETLQTEIRARVRHRLMPEIEKAFQFKVTRIERYIVACYDAETGGYFRPHRDNTTTGTAHRQFAVSINLNDDFEGGDLRFPEFGSRTYRAPKGGAVVFSCTLLHEATPVTRGTRYATLPFLYDEAGKAIRDANLHTLVARPPQQPEPQPQEATA
ncbi:2OG-Fe(II) oxygenase [Phenylobacterium sp. SCN 70-31]|uniref:2OG-Fe(II) oxygenase n=1 Tax=Phenylobacterium sp. SCN 70-31 TaxID=1660129 RepID=UPI00086C2ABD|nr:2OG-Fe(II) oxygenase [Phenylobacterium sp. SCN 70-31]ODT87967.1 MAG: peroxiredoxin [Phenylobacterium sp. SCN 70-31]